MRCLLRLLEVISRPVNSGSSPWVRLDRLSEPEGVGAVLELAIDGAVCRYARCEEVEACGESWGAWGVAVVR